MSYKLIKNESWKDVEIDYKNKQIPALWEKNSLTKLAYITDGTHLSPKTTIEGEYYYLTVRDLNWNGVIDFKNAERVSKQDYDKLVKGNCAPIKKDILLSKDGTVGKVAIFNSDFKTVILSSLALIRCQNILPEYLYFFLKTDYAKENLFDHKNGNAIQRIVLKQLNAFEIFYPEEINQKFMINIFSKQESIIANIEKLIEKNEIIFNELSEQLLSGSLRLKEDNGNIIIYRNPDDNWRSVGMNGESRNIPSDWKIENIRNTIQLSMGSTPKKEEDNYAGNLPWITISNLNTKYISKYTAKIKKTKNIRVFPKGTLLGSFKMSVGRFGFATEECAINEAIMGIKEDGTKNNLNYLYHCLPQVFIDNAEKNGQGLLLLNQEKIKNLEYISPSFDEQILISAFLEKIESSIDTQKNLLKGEKEKFEWLLENLLSGKYLVEEE